MISENAKRDLIETGVHATLAEVYGLVTKILVVNILINVAFLFFPPPVAIGALFAGITVGMLVFMIVSVCTVKADKISRKEAGIIA